MKKNTFIIVLIFVISFVMSTITNILGALVPDVIHDFKLSLFMAGFLPFSFFMAYLLSIPAGMLIEARGEKPVMIFSFGLTLAGSLLLSLFPNYSMALTSLFVIGIGMTMLQVVINPLLRTAGGEEHFAFFSVMAQVVFGGASFVSPHIYTYFVDGLRNHNSDVLIGALAHVVPAELPWVSVYWLFALLSLAMAIMIVFTHLPKVELKEEERIGTVATLKELFRKPVVIAFFLGIFAYVGTEQGISNWISKFLATYHGYNPDKEGAAAVAYFWGFMTVGGVLGLVLLKLFDSRKILTVFVLAGMVTLGVALFTSNRVISRWAFPTCGFCLSVMWPIVFSLGMNSVDKHHGSFAGILCTGIIGGALVPPVIGFVGDHLGLRWGMTLIYLNFSYMLGISLLAKPLVNNATISSQKAAKQNLNAESAVKPG